jgi:hypothetical protein
MKAAPSSTRRSKLKLRRRPGKLKTRNKRRPLHTRRIIRRRVEAIPLPDGSHQETYNAGYDSGYNRGHATGFSLGAYESGEGLVERNLPEGFILPEVTVEQVIASGVPHMQEHMVRLLNSEDIAHQVQQALTHQLPYSLVRLGDGELLALAQDVALSSDQVSRMGPFLPYAGIHVPDYEARELLAAAVREADVIGVPLSRQPTFQPLAFTLFQSYGIDYRNKGLTHSTINYALYLENYLPSILAGQRLLLVGNKASEFAEFLTARGYAVVAAVAPVEGVADTERVLQHIRGIDFDLALVSAGIAAVILATRIARETGKVAIDFGHLADSMITGQAPFA